MAVLQLSRGLVVLIDDCDLELLQEYKWYARPMSGGKNFYAYKQINRRSISMHRFILNAPPGVEVDHINHNGLDNRRCNIRLCTRSQNAMNTRSPRYIAGGFMGVTHKSNGRFKSELQVSGRNITAGVFLTAEEAARARDALALKHFGSFAILNFPEIDPSRARGDAS